MIHLSLPIPYHCDVLTSIDKYINLKYNLLKVNCAKEDTSRYCGKGNDLMKAYLFR